jgi:DNA-binding MarR family transcriptional regulator
MTFIGALWSIETLLAYTIFVDTLIAVNDPVKPRGCTNLKLRQLDRVVTRHYDAYIAASGLKNTQYALLSSVVLLGPIRPSDLARRMRLEASTVTRNLQPLVTQRWLRLGPGEDARSRLVEATADGRAKRAEAQHAWKQAQLALNARLGTKRVAALHALVDDCIERLADVGAES